MKKNLILLFIIHSLLITCLSCTQAQEKKSALQIAVDNLAQKPELLRASIGFVAIDATTGKVVAGFNPNTAFAPASVQKIVSTATALEVLSPKYQFETTIEYSGSIDKNGTLNGDLFIRGGGDPTLGSPRFAGENSKNEFLKNWSKAIKKIGIKKIDGRIIGDAEIYSSATTPSSWTWGHLGNYFGAGTSGLTVYDNTYRLTFKSGAAGKLTKILKTEPPMPAINFVNEVLSSVKSGDNAYIFGAPYSNFRIVRGTIPMHRKEFTIRGSVPDPPLLAAQLLQRKLSEIGIATTDSATTVRLIRLSNKKIRKDRKKIILLKSPQLSEIVKITNMRSFNLFAEHCLMHSSLALSGKADVKTGTRAMTNFWATKGIDVRGMYLADGSGLSRYNAITPSQIANIILYMHKKSRYTEAFESSLPIAGESGTLRSMCKGTIAKGRVKAKSGSIRNVRAYAGLAETTSGKTIVFAMIANNFHGSDRTIRKYFEQIMVKIVAYK